MNIRTLSLYALFFATSCWASERENIFDPPHIDKTETVLSTPDKPLVKKIKPHFAGVRRAAQKKEKKKKSSVKVKNKWVKTETHPKKGKKPATKPQSEAVPSHLPYLE